MLDSTRDPTEMPHPRWPDSLSYRRKEMSRLFHLQDWYASGKCMAEVEEHIDSCVDGCANENQPR
jgi:hypothetical protein